jgi:hypothetical protein
MKQLMQDFGKSEMKGEGKGNTPSGTPEETAASKRRKITIKKITKEELDEMKEKGEISEGGSGGDAPDGAEVFVCEDAEGDDSSESSNGIPTGESGEDDGKGSSKSGSNDDYDITVEESEKYKESKKSKKSKKSSENQNGEEDDSDDGGEENQKESNSKKSSQKSSKQSSEKQNNDSKENDWVATSGEDRKIENVPTPDGFEESDEANGIGEISNEEYELSASDLARIVNEIESEVERYKKEEADFNKEASAPAPDFPITSPKLGKKTCLNYRVCYRPDDKDELEEDYIAVMNKLTPGIKVLVNQFRRMFLNDVEIKEHHTNGKLNIPRLHSPRISARVFDKRIAPVEKSNLAVEILVDESGSMYSCGKATAARLTCIALAEVFATLKIPCYIIGFTADTSAPGHRSHDIVHNHYITWNRNTRAERLKLLDITARANNCDGYSIRYATENLKRAKSVNKLLIVVSDGQPAAHGYYDGVADTKVAIMEAKKNFSVLGVAIGNNDTEIIQGMYEKDFLHISNVEDMFKGISQRLQTIVRRWGR